MQTITEEYRGLNEKLHKSSETYGTSGLRWVKEIYELSEQMKTQDVLDYGCGKSTLAQNLPFNIKQYDPAVKKYDKKPDPADIVVCTDVMEHIEPELLDNVLSDLLRVTKTICFMTIATRPAKKTLADGRNAHLIVENANWWIAKLINVFEIHSIINSGHELIAIVGPQNVTTSQ